jgi:hypothetical protein
MKLWISFVLFLTFITQCAFAEDEYEIDLSEIEKKPYSFGGYLEFKPVFFWLDKDAAFYKLTFFDQEEGNTTDEYNFTLQVDGSYEKGIARVFVRLNSDAVYDYDGWSGKTSIFEGYLSLKPTLSLNIEAGQKTLKWGKGYAWNPVAFLDRPKNPNDTALALEGYIMFTADYIKSFSGALKTVSFTPVLLPVYEDINDDFSNINDMNIAGKLYLLLYDTDIDFIILTEGSKTTRYGFDFSRNITSNFEIHGEFAYINNFTKRTVNSEGQVSEEKYDAKSYLLGIRYLTETDTTFIVEYYHNGTGYSAGEVEDFISFVDKAFETFTATGNDSLLQRASNLTEGNYGRRNPMRDYLYFRISQKEPLDILYFTPAVTWIYNMNDTSFSLSPELLYTGITNLDLRLKASLLSGPENSEYEEKQNDYRAELRVRYYF